jgi:hypothetical protein
MHSPAGEGEEGRVTTCVTPPTSPCQPSVGEETWWEAKGAAPPAYVGAMGTQPSRGRGTLVAGDYNTRPGARLMKNTSGMTTMQSAVINRKQS